VNCRHCGHGLDQTFLDLGSAPPSNAYLDRAGLEAPERWFPLRLLVCGNCWLVQTADYAGRELLFGDDYAYFSSFSSSWLAHARTYVAAMTERFGLGRDSCVVEVAANDGYLLRYVQERGIGCYGVEPTRSTAEAARAIGIEIVEEFFGSALATELAAAGRGADLMTANNVLAHVPDINDFVTGFAILLKPAGVATFEFPHLLRMIAENQFDTAYHEHFSYLSLLAIEAIFVSNGLQVFDVEQLPTHGGSLRIFAQRQGGPHPVTANVARIRTAEQEAGLATVAPYVAFQKAAERVRTNFLRYLLDAQAADLRVGAYGAAAKGNTLLNYAGIRPDLLPYVVDRNPAKAGRFMPGSRIPIVGEEHLRADRPDRIVILPWNLTDEVMEQLAYAREWGARFVTAVPELIER